MVNADNALGVQVAAARGCWLAIVMVNQQSKACDRTWLSGGGSGHGIDFICCRSICEA
jgi:hypothetical protein